MKDPLEEFIKQNRSAFDEKEPSEKVWKNIEMATSFKSRRLWEPLTLWRAAAIVFMVLSVYLLIPKDVSSSQTSDVAVSEFSDVEAYYFQQISEKVEMIDEFQKADGLNGFTLDFQQLDAMYMVLKEEMKASPSQKVKDALVLNLLIRIDLLNQRLHKLEMEYRNEESSADESV